MSINIVEGTREQELETSKLKGIRLVPSPKSLVPKPELLAPAGNLEKLQAALIYGADAVYFGGKNFSLRAYGDNFTREEILQGVDFTHARGKKIYAAVNVFAHNADLNALADYLKFLDGAGVDAVLVSDLGVLALVKELTNLKIHVSTQANVTNWRAAAQKFLTSSKTARRNLKFSFTAQCAFRIRGGVGCRNF